MSAIGQRQARRGLRTLREEFWPLVGQRQHAICPARNFRRTVGDVHRLDFDGRAVLVREEAWGLPLGFIHTYSAYNAVPGPREVPATFATTGRLGTRC